jgi:hypothetical protein
MIQTHLSGKRSMRIIVICLVIFIMWSQRIQAQTEITKEQKDSLYIIEIEDKKGPDKVLHAEPLYIDLIRDLGARKGEKEWNFGMGISDDIKFDTYEALVEYEFAPINRLGFEFELPFTFHARHNRNSIDTVPNDRLNSIKLATQYSFFVNERIATSMAIGYIHEFELADFRSMHKSVYTGNLYNPFFIIAKRWGNNFHSLIYTGPRYLQHFEAQKWHFSYEMHSNIHYMIPGTRNFIGMEVNKSFDNHNVSMTLRPQMRVGVADNFLIGIVAGIPIDRENERLSSFVRIIWEPGHKVHRKYCP